MKHVPFIPLFDGKDIFDGKFEGCSVCLWWIDSPYKDMNSCPGPPELQGAGNQQPLTSCDQYKNGTIGELAPLVIESLW